MEGWKEGRREYVDYRVNVRLIDKKDLVKSGQMKLALKI